MFHPKSELKLIENCGHQLLIDNPVSVNFAIINMTHDANIAKDYMEGKVGKKITKKSKANLENSEWSIDNIE